MSTKGWIGVDLDGTLARYGGWKGETSIGQPVPLMVERVKRWLQEGKDVRIVTARVSCIDKEELEAVGHAIRAWCQEYVGQPLPITCCKDYAMVEIWDDRAIQVQSNTGLIVAERIEQLEAEVESWKNSYERVNRERAELALRLQVDVDNLEEEIANSKLP